LGAVSRYAVSGSASAVSALARIPTFQTARSSVSMRLAVAAFGEDVEADVMAYLQTLPKE